MTSPICPWNGWAEPTVRFCENRLCGWVVEPSNAWSNLIYFAVAGYLLWRYRLQHGPLAAVILSSFLIGVGSFAFHATATRVGEVVDVSAMYIFSALFVAFNVRRLWGTSPRTTWTLLVGLWLLSVTLLVGTGTSGIPLFIVQITAGVGLEALLFFRAKGGVRYRPLVALFGLFAVSYFVWNMDYWGVWCDPDNHVFNGHAFWHIADGVCLVFFYEFHRQFVPLSAAPRTT